MPATARLGPIPYSISPACRALVNVRRNMSGLPSQVRSANAYSLFEEQGVLPAEAGARFRDGARAQGGGRPALESFIAFRGRPPQGDPLLRHNAMSPS
jgi:Zn-dependent oligopeptidase